VKTTNTRAALVNDPRSWSLSDAGYLESIKSLRTACGLPPLPAAK
jgi:hypothetical protein